jgi:2-polyprenyl-3-methyl-5-hydroxy-6-metoxy-1,4-benzoquinol methylase
VSASLADQLIATAPPPPSPRPSLGSRGVKLWDNVLGRQMSLRMERVILHGVRWNQEVYSSWLRGYVNEATCWLDAGCGHRLLPPDFGTLESELTRKARLVVGADLSIDSLQKHKSIFRRACASLEGLPFPDRSFDLVTCNMVVEHLPDPFSTFRELGRVLRTDGVLLVHTPNIWNYAVCVAKLLKRFVPKRILAAMIRWSEQRQDADIFPTFYRANSRASITAQLGSLGFSCSRHEMLVGPQPICPFFAPLAFWELLLMRATLHRLRPFATTMLLSFRKSAGK